MEKRWLIKEAKNENEIKNLAEQLNVDENIAHILVQRGIKTYDEAKSFFRPQLSDLHNPFLMKDMDVAVERLEKAIKNNEKLLIYGDYDVDGTTSVALVYGFLSSRFSNIEYYIPDRDTEGYGISFKAIDYASENNVNLIIALDCGIKAIEKVDYANQKGIDFIICDHHYPEETIPKAVAVLDPKRLDCEYPFKELSGCGVGFKLIEAYCIKNEIAIEELYQYLDLVVVSIASDIVPLVGENRTLAYFGLEKLNSNPSVGLKSIIKTANLGNDISITDIVFKIGPRINAAGRMALGIRSVDLLIAKNEDEAEFIAKDITLFNNQRKDLDQSITSDAILMVQNNEELLNKKTTVLYNPEWHKGVLGIVASRIIETFYRPTVILTKSNGFITGSARSVQGFDLYKAVDACSHLLVNFGGHMFAAGLTLKEENLEEFTKQFEKFVSENITEEQQIPQIEVDAKIKFQEITPKFHRILKQFQPFGPENMKPIFVTEDVSDLGGGKVVGKTLEHLKLDLVSEDSPSKIFPAIGFGMAKYSDVLMKKRNFNICYSIEDNEFMGNTSLQLLIKDIKV